MIIPYGRQQVDESDVSAVVEVLRSDWLTQGPLIDQFERAVADYVCAEHAVAFSSGTAALHGAVAVAGLGAGDVIVTSPLTFMASVNCARYVGATPRLVDIDPRTWNLDLSQMRDTVAAVVAVHYAGLPVDLTSPAWASRPRVLIEDAAHALGAMTPTGPVGNCSHSDMTCFSFHPVKPITSGEGGMVTTNNADLARGLRQFRTHGIVPMPEHGGWYYEISEVGFNYRLTDMQAALGLSQMTRLNQFIESRNALAERYRELLSGWNVGLPPAAPNGWRHGYHLFPVTVPGRRRVFDFLRSVGIGVQVHYVPIHYHPVNSDLGLGPGDLPVTDSVYSGILSLPIYPAMTYTDQDRVVEMLGEALAN
jgi:perosamine synthetase